MFRFSTLGVAAVALAAAAPAAAQDGGATVAKAYVGVVGGYHDLGNGAPGKNGGAIVGGVVGFDVPLSGPVSIGVEGNAEYGFDAVDHEYGVAARLAYNFPSGGLAYVRGGYQWVNVDINQIAGVNLSGFDIPDVAKDYLVGVGGELPLGKPNLRLRVGIDTVSFDTIRPTAGIILGF